MELRLVNVALDVFCILLSLLLLLYLVSQAGRRERLSRYFMGICLLNLGMLLGDLPNWLCEGNARPWYPAALWLGSLLLYLCGAWIMLAYTGYLTAFLSPRVRVNRWYGYAAGLLAAAATALVLLNLYNGMLYYIDGENVYHRGEWWWLSQALPGLTVFLAIAMVLQYRRHMSRKTMATFLAYQFIAFPAIILQSLFYGLACTYPSTTLAIVIIFLNIQSEQALLLEQQKREMAETHISVILSQIHPHFLYNALTAVEDLCETDPPKARRAVNDFAKYLRGNLRALTQKQPVPFTDELRHTRYYLSLEQLRFQNKLKVVQEIGPTDFLVPVLTVQPLVENAVKHGVTCRKSGGTVTLRTEETPDAWQITVEDDGVGFEAGAAPTDGRDHVGIASVRSRLAALCGGVLELQSAPGRGTVAKIILPKGRRV